MIIKIVGVGEFRTIMNTGKMNISIENISEKPVTVYNLISKLDEMFEDQFTKQLYLEDGSINHWTRVMINGRDIRFMDGEIYLNDGDTVLFSTTLAGG